MVDLPHTPDRTPTVRAPTPMVTREDVASPYLQFSRALQAEAQAFGYQAEGFREQAGAAGERARSMRVAAGAIGDVSQEVTDFAKRKGYEAGLEAVTLDQDGNVQVQRPPIVGEAALFYKQGMQTAAVAKGEQVIRDDMIAMRRQFENDPEGFRVAANKYATEKVGQYEKAGGPAVGLALGKIAGNTAREHYNSLLNRKESRDLTEATRAIQLQIETAQNELFAMANGGDTASPEFQERLQKIGVLWGQLAANPRLGVPKERVEYEMSRLKSELDVSSLDFRLKTIQAEQGPDAAIAAAERVRTDPGLNLTPAERFTLHSRLVSGITQRARADQAIDKTIGAEIDSIGESAAKGYPVPPERLAAARAAVRQSSNPALGAALDSVEAAQPIIADWRKSSPQQLEANLATLDRTMRERGSTPQMLALQKIGNDMLKNMRAGIKVDPLGWADRTGAVPVPPIDFSKPNVDAQLRDRAQRAEIVANHYGVAPSYFTPDERSALSAAAAKGGDTMTGLANLFVQGFGEKAPRALAEISKDSPVLAHLGMLTASNGSNAVIQDAARAVELRANPEYKHPRWLTTQSDAIQSAQHARTVEVYGPAFALAPEAARAAEMTAQSAFFTRSARQGYDPKLEGVAWSGSKAAFDKALQEAAGATFLPDGSQVGGVASYRPNAWAPWNSVKVLIPSNIRADRFGDVMSAIRDEDLFTSPKVDMERTGPIDPNGKPYKASDLRNATPVATAGGYRFALGDPFSDDPKWIRGTGGQPYVLDLKRLEPELRKRVPSAYIGGQ